MTEPIHSEDCTFHEVDARLAGMHGYAGVTQLRDCEESVLPGEAITCPKCRAMVSVPLIAVTVNEATRLEAKLDALETLVRALIHAMKAGAVGRWT